MKKETERIVKESSYFCDQCGVEMKFGLYDYSTARSIKAIRSHIGDKDFCSLNCLNGYLKHHHGIEISFS